MISKRLFCFQSNMNSLCTNRRTYLWTFTLPSLDGNPVYVRKSAGEYVLAEGYKAMRVLWNRCLTYIRRRCPEWAGMRVYEVHPGAWGEFSHGLHVHVVANKFHDINLVRGAAQAAGFGRVHVVKRRHSMGFYLSKYLSKPRPDALRGWRMWACFNMPGRSLISDIVIDSLRGNLFRLGHSTGAFVSLGWADKAALVGKWVWQTVAGVPLDLPFVKWRRHFAPQYPRDAGWSSVWGMRRVRPVLWGNVSLPWGFQRAAPAPVEADPYAFLSCWGSDRLLADCRRNRSFKNSTKPSIC